MGRNWRNGNHCFKEFGVQEANASRKRDVQLGFIQGHTLIALKNLYRAYLESLVNQS